MNDLPAASAQAARFPFAAVARNLPPRARMFLAEAARNNEYPYFEIEQRARRAALGSA